MSDEMRGLEKTFAYEHVAGIIEKLCNQVETIEPTDEEWFDLETAYIELVDEIRYLDSRRLLQRHPEHANWVRICDEGEPIEEVAK